MNARTANASGNGNGPTSDGEKSGYLLPAGVSLPDEGAVKIYLYPKSSKISVKGLQSLTAFVTGSQNKAVKWTNSCGLSGEKSF